MAQVGTLTVDLIAQTASFNANIERAAANLNSQTARMNRAIGSVQKNVAAMRAEAEGLALGIAIKGAAGFVRQQLEMAGSLGEVAQQLGVTTGQLQAYRAIGVQVGVAQEDMDKGLAKLTLSLGNAAAGSREQAAAFGALGISLRDSSGHVRTAGDALPLIADALAKIPDPAQRAAMEVALFGRAGQKLDTVLSGGSRSIEDYTARARDMGMILGDDVIAKADTAADTIAELNKQLSANIQNAIASNASSIIALAKALEVLTTRAIQFISQYPGLSGALAGAAAGSRFGLPGALIGAGAGAMAGRSAASAAADANPDLAFRSQKLRDAAGVLKRAKAVAGSPAFYASQEREFKRQQALYNEAWQKHVAGSVPKPVMPAADLPQFNASGGGGGGGGRGGRGPTRDFAERLDRLNLDLLRAKRANVIEAEDMLRIDLAQIKVDQDKYNVEVDAALKAGHISQAQAEQLTLLNAQVTAQQALSATVEASERMAREQLDARMAANDNERDMLRATEALARTAPERRDVQLRLLDLDKQEERLKLEAVAASASATEAEKRIAQARLGQLDAIYGVRAEGIKKDTQGPLGQYFDQIPQSAAEINQALENVAAQGLDSLNQGIVDAIMGAKSLAGVFKNVANQIIGDLLRIAVQKALIGPIANFLFADTANMVGGFFGSIFGGGFSTDLVAPVFSGDSVLAGARAGGGPVSGGSAYLVGENGPEIFRPSASGSIIPNHRLGSMQSSFGGAGGALRVEVVASKYFDVRVQDNIAMAAPAIVEAGAQAGETRSLYRQSRRVA